MSAAATTSSFSSSPNAVVGGIGAAAGEFKEEGDGREIGGVGVDTSAVVALAAAHSSAVNALLGQGSVSTRSAHAAKMIGLGLGLGGGSGGGNGGGGSNGSTATKGDRSNAWQMLTAGDTPINPHMTNSFPFCSFSSPLPPRTHPSPTDPVLIPPPPSFPPLRPLILLSPPPSLNPLLSPLP